MSTVPSTPPGPPESPGIGPGCGVALHLEVRFADGLVALSTFGEAPIRCRIGDGALAPALEQRLAGLTAGSSCQIAAHGSELFGPYEPSNRHWLDLQDFPADQPPKPGRVMSFTSPAGHEISGIVLGVDDMRVEVDFNHPLSGRELSLRVEVLEVER